MPPPPTSPEQRFFQGRLDFNDIIPTNGSPNYVLFILILGGITGLALLATLIRCLAGCCSKSSRKQRKIERKARKDFEKAEKSGEMTRRNSNSFAGESDDACERRTSHLLSMKNFEGREQKLYPDSKKSKLNQSWTGMPITLPVVMGSRPSISQTPGQFATANGSPHTGISQPISQRASFVPVQPNEANGTQSRRPSILACLDHDADAPEPTAEQVKGQQGGSPLPSTSQPIEAQN